MAQIQLRAQRTPARDSRPAAGRSRVRPTYAAVDLDALAHNLHVVTAAAGGAPVLAVVKADGYGHGAAAVAQRLEAEGAFGFGVALAEEALALRALGVRRPIVILNGVHGAAHAEIVDARLTPVVYDPGEVEAFARAVACRRDERPFGLHLKIDTGMARLGAFGQTLDATLRAIEQSPGVFLEGVLTHLATADTDRDFALEQVVRFELSLATIRARGHRPRWVHASNSAATLMLPEARYDLVRPGIALYGYGAGPAPTVARLRPALRVCTEVVALRDLPAGAPVGYDCTFTTRRPSRIATLPVGYADGVRRAASNRGVVLIEGRRCPIAGRVSMDLLSIDVTDAPSVHVGSEAVLIGEQGGARIEANEVASWADTTAYEVLTGVSVRVPRVYLGAAGPSAPAG